MPNALSYRFNFSRFKLNDGKLNAQYPCSLLTMLTMSSLAAAAFVAFTHEDSWGGA